VDLATGEVFAKLAGHEQEAKRFAFSPKGKVLASADADATVLLWDSAAHKPPPLAVKKHSADDLQRLWADLSADDAVAAHRAFWTFMANSDAAMLTIKDKLKLAIADGEQVQKLIQELDDDDFEVRSRATAELEDLGELASDALRKAAGKTELPEVQRRLKDLLDRLEAFPVSGERLRALRAMRLLDQIGTADAREVLERMAMGGATSRVTIAAKAALERLKAR
jgi:hypothetical protein